jgi:hypothetical protein
MGNIKANVVKMTITNHYPPRLYLFLLDLANKNGPLAIKEVETIFLRRQAEALGFKCDHLRIGFAKKTNQPFCKDCWTRMKTVKAATFQGRKIIKEGEYWPLETFLDRFHKEQVKTETENRVTGSENLI